MKPKSKMDYRLSGVFLALLGGGVTYWQILSPIFTALNGARQIEYSGKLAALGPLALIIGLFMIVYGADAAPVLNGKFSRPVLVLVIIGIIAYTFACLFGMEYIFKSLGYN